MEMMTNNTETNQIRIKQFSNGNVTVEGFPYNPGEAYEILLLALKAMTDFFTNAALDGRLKRDSKIVVPHMNDIINYN